VSDPLLTFLKYIFLAVLYLFFLRVLRAVWVELREPKPAPVPAAPPPPQAPPVPAPGSRRRRGPDHGGERLVVVEPPERRGQEFALADELTVGRAGGCGVPLPDDTFVSQLHARVFRRNGQLYVEDLGSTNGTYLNKKKVASAVAMRKGDKLKIGQTTLEVQR
jgi:pSer/pThr/pTyr-binding forkhead associated (FHA) protein